MVNSAHAADKITCSMTMNRTCVIAAFDCALLVNSAHAADTTFSFYSAFIKAIYYTCTTIISAHAAGKITCSFDITCIFAIFDSAAAVSRAAHAACYTIANYSAAVRTVLEFASIIRSAYTSPQHIELKI